MTPEARDAGAERWLRIATLLDEALELDPVERERFLELACADDATLHREVASLLAAHDRPGAFDRLAGELAPLAARVRESAAPLVGRTFGRYQVIRPVGSGGMGVVVEALDLPLDRTVALKFLRPLLNADDSAAERFRLEARTVAALEHPNVCTVHEIGETDDGQLFLAMPLYAGETLQQRLARGPLPIGEAVGIAVQIARGLAKAHGRGIVHRDVKPSNVFLTEDGVVKVLDFGIAKLADVTLTDAGGGGPQGTAAYMSPEQARSGSVDHRADLWSLGVVLYEMLAGRRPVAGDAAPVPVSTLRPDVPPALARIVATALAASPDARYQSASSLEEDLLVLGLVGGAPARPRWTRAARPAVAAALLCAVIALAWVTRGTRGATGDVPATVAVLPFVDRSPGQDQEYFSDGITDELIATLAQVEGLRVASRTSAFAFKGRGVDVRTVGEQLGVATVLEGSVRRAGSRLRITAQLVNAAEGYPLWSQSYDRDVGDAVAIQEEIARAIAQTLRVQLVAPDAREHARDAPDASTYDMYLKGRYAWYGRTEAGMRAAAGYFEQAIARAPAYARAHAGLADAYAVLGFYDHLSPTEAFPKAEAAARRAAALDPRLAAPRATLGYVALYHHWDLARGEEEFRHAIALDPNYSTARQWYANLLTAAGRFPEAVREMRRAEEIDPLSLIAKSALGWVFHHAGDPEGALRQSRQTLELNPDYPLALLCAGWALQALDSLPGAVAMHHRAVAATDSGAIYVAALARSLALAGERPAAEALLRRLEARSDSGRYVPSYEIAKIHDALGRRDRAFEWLERARVQRSHSLVLLGVDPQLAPLRADPRYARLLTRTRRELGPAEGRRRGIAGSSGSSGPARGMASSGPPPYFAPQSM